MKQLFSLLLCLCLLCGLAACGSPAESPEMLPPEDTATTPVPESDTGIETPVTAPTTEISAINSTALEYLTVDIAVIYPENTANEDKASYGLQRLDEHYLPLDDTVYGDGESLSISAGELARFTPADVADLIPSVHYTEGSVLAQELGGTVYITVIQASEGVMNLTVDYTNTIRKGRLHGPASEDPASEAPASEDPANEGPTVATEDFTIRFEIQGLPEELVSSDLIVRKERTSVHNSMVPYTGSNAVSNFSAYVSEGEWAIFGYAAVPGYTASWPKNVSTIAGGYFAQFNEAPSGTVVLTYKERAPVGNNEPANPEPTADSNQPYTIRFLGCRYPDGHDAASDPGGLRVYKDPDDLSAYTDYTTVCDLEFAPDETFCYSILPTRANTSQGAGLHTAEAVLSDDLPRYLHRGNADLEIVYSTPGPISIGPARQDLHFTVEVIYPEGIAEEDKAACGIQALDADMNPMEGRSYGHGDSFSVPYAHWAGVTPLQPDRAVLTYSEADAYTITPRDIPCTIFRSAESGEVTITVDYSQN